MRCAAREEGGFATEGGKRQELVVLLGVGLFTRIKCAQATKSTAGTVAVDEFLFRCTINYCTLDKAKPGKAEGSKFTVRHCLYSNQPKITLMSKDKVPRRDSSLAQCKARSQTKA